MMTTHANSLPASSFCCSFQLEELKSLNGEVTKLISNKSSSPTRKAVPEDPVDTLRREKVKEAMIHAWSSYEKYAWGHDELQV